MVTAASLGSFLARRLGGNVRVERQGEITLVRPPGRPVRLRLTTPDATPERLRISDAEQHVVREGAVDAGIFATILAPGTYSVERVATGQATRFEVGLGSDVLELEVFTPPSWKPRRVINRRQLSRPANRRCRPRGPRVGTSFDGTRLLGLLRCAMSPKLNQARRAAARLALQGLPGITVPDPNPPRVHDAHARCAG
jgi:hypothetical protein